MHDKKQFKKARARNHAHKYLIQKDRAGRKRWGWDWNTQNLEILPKIRKKKMTMAELVAMMDDVPEAEPCIIEDGVQISFIGNCCHIEMAA